MDQNEERYVKSLETYVKQLEDEVSTYQVLLAMHLSAPGHFCQPYEIDFDPYEKPKGYDLKSTYNEWVGEVSRKIDKYQGA